jgi:hypothetical protein
MIIVSGLSRILARLLVLHWYTGDKLSVVGLFQLQSHAPNVCPQRRTQETF